MGYFDLTKGWKPTTWNPGTIYCRPNLRGKGRLGRSSKKRCPDCGMRIRGDNHAEGVHHRMKLK